jgi:hypothetical protein
VALADIEIDNDFHLFTLDAIHRLRAFGEQSWPAG